LGINAPYAIIINFKPPEALENFIPAINFHFGMISARRIAVAKPSMLLFPFGAPRGSSGNSMPVRETEAIILRTVPINEADKIVSFLSREEGRTRGVAPNARRSLKRFGATLEPLSHVRLRYQDHAARDLVRLESAELLDSFFEIQGQYEVAVGSSYLAEVCELLLPEREANDPFFRLVLLVMEEIRRTGDIWRPLTYFDLWAVKLAGFLPPMGACIRCREQLPPGHPAWFRPHWDGLLCKNCRVPSGDEGAWTISAESRDLAREMLAAVLTSLPAEGWSKARAEDLRRFLGQHLERHLERKLVTRRQLEAL
jgi:DNA repair protein RecO (recombination protein O)